MWELVIELMREFILMMMTRLLTCLSKSLGMEMAVPLGKNKGTQMEIRELASKKVKPKTMGAVANALRNKHWFLRLMSQVL